MKWKQQATVAPVLNKKKYYKNANQLNKNKTEYILTFNVHH